VGPLVTQMVAGVNRYKSRTMNELAVTVGMILFPGLIACIICDKITVHAPKWDSFKYSVYSFVFGVICYLLLQTVYFGWWLLACHAKTPMDTYNLDVWSIVDIPKGSVNLAEVFWATILAPVVAGLAAWTVNYKFVNKIAKWLRLSDKYGDENLYSYFLNSQDVDWIYVRDIQNKLTYQGRVVSFSENSSMQEILLSDVTVYSYETSDEFYSVPFLYLAKTGGTFIIEAVPPSLLEIVNGKETIA
jgi:hypothetical protein